MTTSKACTTILVFTLALAGNLASVAWADDAQQAVSATSGKSTASSVRYTPRKDEMRSGFID